MEISGKVGKVQAWILTIVRAILQTIVQNNLIMQALAITVAVLAVHTSFHGYAGFLVADLDSDQAIQALMAADLQLPADLYYWGQQRGGSITPVLGNFLLRHSHLSAIEAVSYSHYFVLIIGYIAFASILKTNIARILFALAWFLPMHRFGFLLMLGHPYAAQLSFLAMAIALINKLPQKIDWFRTILRHVMITAAVGCLYISLWASDFSLISLALLVVFAVLGILYRIWFAPVTLFSPKILSIPLLLILIALEIANILITSRYGSQFIRYAKAHASANEGLFGFNNLAQAKQLFDSVTHAIAQSVTFKLADHRWSNIIISAIVWFWIGIAIFLISYALLYLIKFWLRSQNFQLAPLRLSPWIGFFLINAAIGFVAIIFSEWVYVNSMQDASGGRYFVPIYIFIWFAALLLVEGIPSLAAKPFWVILLVVAVAGSATLPASVYGIEKFQPTIQRLQPLQQLGNAGIIGSHWASYLLCSVNPKALSCTQFDEYGQMFCPAADAPPVRRPSGRCFRCVDRVLNSPAIYLVKNQWLESFPDETEQFGECLVRTGEPFDLAGYTMAPYQRRSWP